MADLDGLSCALCFERYNDRERVPISLDCGHTFCKACLIRGKIVACPTCRATVTKPVSQLRPNYGVLDALVASGADIVEQLDGLGLSGSARFVLPPSSVELVEVLTSVGAMGQVWRGKLDGNEVSMTCRALHSMVGAALQLALTQAHDRSKSSVAPASPGPAPVARSPSRCCSCPTASRTTTRSSPP